MTTLRHGQCLRGQRPTATYSAWQAMKKRCCEPNHRSYKHYGGRGITVCDRWQTFDNFYADMGEQPPGHTLDRIDVNGNYEPSNCRWATAHEQSRNRRTNRLIEFNGETLCVVDWARRVGIHQNTLWQRIITGWPVERALTEPTATQFRKKSGSRAAAK